MKKRVTIQAWECICERQGCPSHGKAWIFVGDEPPTICRFCRSREWDGRKPQRQPSRTAIELPAPAKVRNDFDDEF